MYEDAKACVSYVLYMYKCKCMILDVIVSNVVKTIINHPPNHHKLGGKNYSQMGGLLLF